MNHGELVLNDSALEVVSATANSASHSPTTLSENYDYIKQQPPTQQSPQQKDDKLLEFYKNIGDARVSQMLL